MENILKDIIIILIVLISGVCFIRLLWYRKEIKKINKQLEFLMKNDSNRNITQDFSTIELREMINRINEVVNKYRKLQIEACKRGASIKDDFQNLSHDIRTPLTSISGYFQMLCTSTDEEEKKRYTKVLNERISSIEAMLENIFTYSKLQNEKYVIDMHKVNFGDIVMNTTLSFYEDMKKYELEPVVDYSEKTFYVNGNEDAFTRIIQNIIKNAIEHGHKDIDLKLEEQQGSVLFMCSNDIQNINEIDIDKVFMRFYKADKSRSHSSTGLGLSIAKMLSDRMGADLSAVIDDKGRFTICLKCKTYG